MTYSVEAFLFRAAVGVVNTAARAANGVLQVMYPQDISHMWDDRLSSSVAGVAAGDGTAADPRAADPGGVTTTPTSTPPGSLTWEGWCRPAILDVLASHTPKVSSSTGDVFCLHDDDEALVCSDWIDWHEHLADEIAARIACDPQRAVLALTSLQKQ